MKINRIELYNIGPYEGLNMFDIAGQSKTGKITVIGGKNGAGKTTLFSAIKLCLYGHREAGYQAINAYYKRNIKKLINDKAKLENGTEAFVQLELEIFNGQDWDVYSLKRSWVLDSDNFEEFSVIKNSFVLSDEEIGDFDNYLLNLIPPELFDLYFFDGEQIADFFLEDESGERIKKAFMTICGYDTFDIILKNFKRLGKTACTNDSALDAYFQADDKLRAANAKLNACNVALEETSEAIELLDTEIAALEKKYTSGGGVTLEKWNQNFLDLKTEERLREEKNAWLKNAANDTIPYIILHDEINELLTQMNLEKDMEWQMVLLDAMDSMIPQVLEEVSDTTPGFSKTAKDKVQRKIAEIIKSKMHDGTAILNLSKDEYELLVRQSAQLLAYDKKGIIAARNDIKKSIKRSQISRENIESSSVADIDRYLKKKEQLIENKRGKVECKEGLLISQKELQAEAEKAQALYLSAEKNIEKHLKDESISDLTTRSIRFLDVLQRRLFRSEIEKVESLFMKKMNQLMRKEKFLCKIVIDDDFTLHVYRNVRQSLKTICGNINSLKSEGYEKKYGRIHCDELLKACKCATLEQLFFKYKNEPTEIDTVLEFDKTIMSKGEKQVFIMALYWSIMELCNKEVPFVIDTPFARIDTVHRAHITEYFFKELKGQVFIFSTDEEITDEHLNVIGKDLQSKFLIENIDNSKTTVTPGVYFGESI